MVTIRFPQLPVAGGQRQAKPQSQLKVGRVVKRQSIRIRQAERVTPRETAGVRVDLDIQQSEIREGRVAECSVDSLLPDCGLQAVGKLQPPELRNRSPADLDAIQHGLRRFRALVRKQPRERH